MPSNYFSTSNASKSISVFDNDASGQGVVVQNNHVMQHAVAVIKSTYGDVVQIKNKSLLKFGHIFRSSNNCAKKQ